MRKQTGKLTAKKKKGVRRVQHMLLAGTANQPASSCCTCDFPWLQM
jgi:hypothetical protein